MIKKIVVISVIAILLIGTITFTILKNKSNSNKSIAYKFDVSENNIKKIRFCFNTNISPAKRTYKEVYDKNAIKKIVELYNGINFAKQTTNTGSQSPDLCFYGNNGNIVLSLDTFGGVHLYKDETIYIVKTNQKQEFLNSGKKAQKIIGE